MAYIYAIHDPWFHGMADGDVDDRAAFCAYEWYLSNNPTQKIIVHVGDRTAETFRHYGHFRITFTETFLEEDIANAQKICICAPVKDPAQREILRRSLTKGNGYCQGCKIGCMNFPNQSYMPLLESIPNEHRYSTVETMIPFPVSFIQRLDPRYSQHYQEYGYLKLFSPGAVVHVPGLLYRLYCPEMGGGPGTNMLTIQRCLQKHFNLLPDIPVDKDHFARFNRTLIEENELTPIPAILRATQIPELIDSLTVMVYFANKIYGKVYQEDSEIYSLKTLPPGRIDLVETETPPLYDLIVAHAVLYNQTLPTKEEIIDFYQSP